jgi:hypothetical protein
MTKNVALVDDELQGKEYTSNKGGSGFGKFKKLPNPKVIGFQKNKDLEVFIGSHDGFENVGVTYSRQVINVENYFWIVKDNFSSDKKHNYKQVWQGHYSKENSDNLLRSSFQNGSGLDIYQLTKVDTVFTDGARGKHWSVVSKNESQYFNFITVLFPFSKYNERVEERKESPNFKNWKIDSSKLKSDANKTLSKNNKNLFFGVQHLKFNNISLDFSEKVDVFVKIEGDKVFIQSLFDTDFFVKASKINTITFNQKVVNDQILLQPLAFFTIR